MAVGKETGEKRASGQKLANGAKGRENAALTAFCKVPSTGIVDKRKGASKLDRPYPFV